MSFPRLAILGFFFLLTASGGFAQQKVLDSLLVLESGLTKQDSQAVTVYIGISNAYQNLKVENSLKYALKAVDASRNLKDPRLLSLSLAGKGTAHYLLLQYDEALESYREALRLTLGLDDKRLIARNYNNIGLVYASIADHPKALEYYLKALQFNEALENVAGIINNLGNIGAAFNTLNEPGEAIEYFDKALALCDASTNPAIVSGLMNNLGNAYTALDDLDKALEYKLKALEISEKSNNRFRIANSLGNLGHLYAKMGLWDKAMDAHQKSLAINGKLNDRKGILSSYMGLAGVFFSTDQLDSSKVYFFKANQLALEIGDVKTRAASLEKLSAIYENFYQNDSSYLFYKEFVNLQNGLDNDRKLIEIKQSTLKFQFAKKEDSLLREQLIIDNQLKEKTLLAERQEQKLQLQNAEILLSEKQKQIQKLAILKSQADLKLEQNARSEKEKQLELVEKEKIIQQSELQLQGAELELKNNRIQRQNTLRKFYLAGLALLAVLGALIYRNARFQKKTNVIIKDEKSKSDRLLLNILPQEVAEELKEKGSARAKYFEEVSVIFTDFVSFTKVSESLSPEELVNELNECFSAFDRIVYEHGIEKIKTIGDAYMAVAGLPSYCADHAEKAILAAMELVDFIENRRKSRPFGFEIRIGIHSGPVIAGIVGTKKFAYDIWGDTVNIAARMESSGAAGRVNISDRTYQLAKDRFRFESRGKVMAKNKGEMEMYFVGNSGE
ncbi:MAG: tetratricopeptide repeat protein [Saprospirales bacterium]|nr:tetratricopeptide repeat protein [Saprospirales bacterium]